MLVKFLVRHNFETPIYDVQLKSYKVCTFYYFGFILFLFYSFFITQLMKTNGKNNIIIMIYYYYYYYPIDALCILYIVTTRL